jgi:hypothetical protein
VRRSACGAFTSAGFARPRNPVLSPGDTQCVRRGPPNASSLCHILHPFVVSLVLGRRCRIAGHRDASGAGTSPFPQREGARGPGQERPIRLRPRTPRDRIDGCGTERWISQRPASQQCRKRDRQIAERVPRRIRTADHSSWANRLACREEKPGWRTIRRAPSSSRLGTAAIRLLRKVRSTLGSVKGFLLGLSPVPGGLGPQRGAAGLRRERAVGDPLP